MQICNLLQPRLLSVCPKSFEAAQESVRRRVERMRMFFKMKERATVQGHWRRKWGTSPWFPEQLACRLINRIYGGFIVGSASPIRWPVWNLLTKQHSTSLTCPELPFEIFYNVIRWHWCELIFMFHVWMFLSLVPTVHQPVAVYWSVCIRVCVCLRGNPVVAGVDDIACFNRTWGDAGH